MHVTPCSGELKFDEAAYAAGKLEMDTEVIHLEEKRADNGYTLICNTNGQAVYLIDIKGRVVHQWALPEGMMIWANFMLLENGYLIRAILERDPGINKGGPCSIFGENIPIYNARRYSPDFPGLAGRDLTPGKTIAGRKI